MELFQLFGKVVIDNEKANKEIDQTTSKAEGSQSKVSKSFKGIGTSALNVSKKMASVGVAVGGAALGLAEGSREYRTSIGQLEAGFTASGHSANTATKTYRDLYAILGETDTSVEAANLMAQLCDSEEELATWTDICTGVYATFPDSIPIESFVEAANETAKVGQVTGTLADALNWLGISEDEFNEKLKACSSEQERQDLIMNTLNGTYSKAAQKYREVNKDVMEANLAQARMTDAMAKLGAIVEPVVTKVKNAIATVVDVFASMPAPIQKIVTAIGAVIAIGTPLLAVFGTVANGLGSIIGLFGKMRSAIGLAKTAFSLLSGVFMANPIALVVAAIAGLVAAFVHLWNNCEGFREFWINLWNKIKEIAVSVWNGIKDFFAAIWGGIKSLFETIFGGIASFFSGLWNGVKTVAETVWNGLSAFFSMIWGGIKLLAETIWGGISSFFSTIWNGVKTVVETVWNGISSFLSTIWNGIKNTAVAVWNGIKTAITTVLNTIKSVVSTVWNGIKSVITTIVNGIKSFISTAWNAIKSIVTTVLNGIKSAVSTVWNGIKSVITTVLNAIKSVVSKIWNSIKSVITTAVNAIKNVVTKAWNGMKSVVTSVMNGIKSVVSNVWNGVKSIITTVLNTVKKAVSAAWGGIKNITSSVFNGIKKVTSTVWNGIKNAITKPIETAKNTIKRIIDTIKGFFANFNIRLPHIKLPHFSISPKGWSIGDLLKGSIPSLGIEWYAKGGVLTKPTVFGVNPATGSAMAGGEAGAEAVAPIDTLMDYVRTAVQEENSGQAAVLQMILSVLQQILKKDTSIQIDGNEIIKVTNKGLGAAL